MHPIPSGREHYNPQGVFSLLQYQVPYTNGDALHEDPVLKDTEILQAHRI